MNRIYVLQLLNSLEIEETPLIMLKIHLVDLKSVWSNSIDSNDSYSS